MEFYLALKKKEILLFATIWRNLEDNIQSELNQTQKDMYYKISHICGILKNSQTHSNRLEWWLSEPKREDIDQRAQISSYKMNKLWRANTQHGVYR